MATDLDPKKLAQMEADAKKLGMTFKEYTKHLVDAKRAMDNLAKSANGFTDTFAKGIRETDDAIDDLGDALKSLAWDDGLPTDEAIEFTKTISGLQKDLIDIKKVGGPLSKKDLDKQSEKLDKIKSDIMVARKNMVAALPTSKKMSNSMRLMGQGAGDFGSMWKSIGSKSPRQLKETAEAAGKTAFQMKAWGANLAGSGKMFSGIGKMVGTLGKSLGGLAKWIAGPVGIAAIAVKAIWDIGMAADRFKKNANKAFAMVRGPDIMTKDVKGQFKKFNDAVYSIGENMRTGLQPEQVNEFFLSVYQAGTNIDRLTKGYGSYRDAVYMAAKASKTMGMELPQVGAMMSDLMNNFRMDMKNIDQLFVQTAFSAQKAGVSTDKFWNAVTNANASLAFYGVYLGNTSKLLQKFTQSGVMGFDDASNMVTTLTQSFKNMSSEQKASFIALSKGGGTAIKAFMKSNKEKLEAQLGTLETDIKAKATLMESTKDEAEKAKIAEEIEVMRLQSTGLLSKIQLTNEAMQQKTAVAMAEYLPLVSDNTAELVSDMLKTQLGVNSMREITGSGIILHQKVLEAQGFNADILMRMKQLSEESYQSLTGILGVNEKGSQASENVLGKLGLLKGMTEDITALKDGDKTASARIISALTADGKTSREGAENIVKTMALDSRISGAVLKAIEDSNARIPMSVIAARLKSGFDATGAHDKEALSVGEEAKEAQEEQMEAAQKSFNEIRDQTLSYDEIQSMTEKGLQWQTASLSAATFLNDLVFGIYKKMLDTDKSPDQIRAEKARGEAGYENKATWFSAFRTSEYADVQPAIKTSAQAVGYGEKNLQSIQKTLADLRAKSIEMHKNDSTATDEEKKALTEQIKATEGTEKKIIENLNNAKEQLKMLTAGNKTSEKSAKILTMIYMGDKKAAGDQIAALLDEGMSPLDVAAELGINLTDLAESLMTAGKWEGRELKGDVSAPYVARAKERFEEAKVRETAASVSTPSAPVATTVPPAPQTTQAGLIGSRPIKKQSELILAHRGETLMGANQGSKTINIVVNANEQDLASRVANEIEAALHRVG